MPALIYCLAKVPVSEGCAVLQANITASGMHICQKRPSALCLYHLGMHERQVNPLTAYAMMSVLDVPKGEWLAQACTLPWIQMDQECCPCLSVYVVLGQTEITSMHICQLSASPHPAFPSGMPHHVVQPLQPATSPITLFAQRTPQVVQD